MTNSNWCITLSLAIFFICCKAEGFIQRTTLNKDVLQKTVSLEHPARLLLSNLGQNNYLRAYKALKKNEQAYMESRFKTSYLETMALISYYIGEVAASVEMDSIFRKNRPNPALVNSFSSGNYILRNVNETLKQVAKQEQVVMINEEHRFPQHRALTSSLLQMFYNEGFRYLALETLTALDTLLHKRGYVTQRSGFYTADPVYAVMVRDAIRIGYKIIPYEFEENCQSNNCDNERERGQAKNLYERILKDNPHAKILVHAGRAHIAELRENDSTAFMAWHFKEITKIDPFTIDQLWFCDNSGREFQKPLYQFLVQKNKVISPVVVANADSSLYRPSHYNMHILHPINAYVHDRPTWLNQGRRFTKINVKKLGLNNVSPGNALIQAFTNPVDSLEIPVDQVLFKKGVQQLLLPKGRFLIRAVDSNNLVLGSYYHKN